MTQLEDNELLIQEELESRREELIERLTNLLDERTNDFFVEEELEQISSLIDLCKESIKILCPLNIAATTPTAPQNINSNSIYAREKNIHNKVQYCNNILRYTLRKKGINFHNSNSLEELIQYLQQIRLMKMYDSYVTNISMDLNGDLLIDTITYYELSNNPVVTNLRIDNNGDLVFDSNNVYEVEYDDVILSVDKDSNDDIIFTRVSDVE